MLAKRSSMASKIFLAFAYLFLYLPIVVLIIFSFNASSSNYVWHGFTLNWYRELVHSPDIWDPFCNSMIIGVSAVFLSVTLSLMFIWSLRWRYSKLYSIFYSTMLFPDIVIAVGLLSLFSFFAVPLGLATLIAGHTLLGLGFTVPIIYSRYVELDPRIVEASLDLGASNAQTFRKIVVPFLAPAIFSSMLSVFILSLDDFLISFFCASSESQTLSLYIYAMVRTGVSPVINAISTMILVASSILVIMFSYLRVKMSRENE